MANKQPATQSHKARIEAAYGRQFSDEEVEHYGARLQRQVNALERLRVWESELGLIEPATVSRIMGGPVS